MGGGWRGVYNESKRGSLSFVILKQKIGNACSGCLDFLLVEDLGRWLERLIRSQVCS